MRAALIHVETGKVENIIELPDDYVPEAEGAYLPPEGFKIEKDDEKKAEIGGHLNNGVWEPAEVPEPEPIPMSTQEQLDALTANLVAKGTLTASEVAATKTRRPAGSPVSPNP